MDCIFCKIVKGEIPSTKVYEDEMILAFRDIDPKAPSHVVIIPKEHYANIVEIPANSGVMEAVLNAIKEVAKAEDVVDSGFRIINNYKSDGGQSVDHVHFHMLGKRSLQWPPGQNNSLIKKALKKSEKTSII